ncbi:HNH endonuclease [Aerosakkonemataceae cyanobacterium BLCC-F50]|uniref:HNH endonuclease n=1 Tax=Floridaenema flaviceps BLCC-F50 TaxID=3153642 RepID=A0ABV4XIT5_9CYAN
MSRFSYVVRRLVASNLGWFLETRKTVGEAGRERAVNINKPIFYDWFPHVVPTENRVYVKCRYFAADGTQLSSHIIIEDSRPVALQGKGKNWRLAGDAIQGLFYGSIREGDLMIMVFDKATIPFPTLSWICIRSPEGQPYRVIPITEEQAYYNILELLGQDTRNMWTPTVDIALVVTQQIKQLYPAAGELLMELEMTIDGCRHASDDIRQLLIVRNNSSYILETDEDEQAETADNSTIPDYSPVASDRRQVAMRQIRVRRGQSAFRKALRSRYGEQCMITGCNLMEVVDAAHISPYRGEEDNHPDNGLLLRTDLHTLFDLDFLGIHPESLRIQLHPAALAAGYHFPENHTLLCANERPSQIALESRWTLFQMRLQA